MKNQQQFWFSDLKKAKQSVFICAVRRFENSSLFKSAPELILK